MNALFDTSLDIAAGRRSLVHIDRYTIEEGNLTFLFGESGIGKTLAAKAVCGLLDADELEVSIGGGGYDTYRSSVRARNIREKGFFVFQEPSSHLDPLQTLAEQLQEGDLRGRSGEDEIFEQLWPRERKADIPVLLGLYPQPVRPSGGEKQRMLIAMAFKKMFRVMHDKTSSSGLFVFDEPTGSLDDDIRDRFLRYLLTHFSSGRFTGLLMTHDYSMISMLRRSSEAMRRRIVLTELVRGDGSVFMRQYAPGEYTDWLNGSREGRRPFRGEPRLLASVGSRVHVHDRKLHFSAGPTDEAETRLDIRSGQLTYLKAPSGTGKTTIAKAMLGLVTPRRLRMRVGNVTLSERTPQQYWRTNLLGKTMTMSFQHADEALSQQAMVPDVFDALPGRASRNKTPVRRMLALLFEPSEVESFQTRRVRTLSGGQKQRLNLLRCLVLDAPIVILDEPLNGLDLESARKVLSLIVLQKERGKGFLVISHNEEIFDAHADATVYLQRRE